MFLRESIATNSHEGKFRFRLGQYRRVASVLLPQTIDSTCCGMVCLLWHGLRTMPPTGTEGLPGQGDLRSTGVADSILRLWDLDSHRARTQLRLDVGELLGVAFAPDNKTLAVCGDDHKIRLWTVADLLKPSTPR